MRKSVFVIVAVGLGLCLTNSPAWARQRSQSGSFQGSKGRSGTYERSALRQPGQASKNATMTTGKGTSSHSAQATWDKDSKTGTHSSSSTAANGKTRSSESKVVKNEDGSYTATGTATKADGQTMTSSRTVQKTESGHSTTGSYSTSTGKSGAFGSNTTVTKGEFGEVNKNSYVTNQDGETWEKTESKEKVGSTVFGDVSVVNPDGKEVVNRSSITTVDSNEK